jgi:uncharacterized protein
MSTWQQAEYHRFDAGGQFFLYMVPSGGIFSVGAISQEVLTLLEERGRMDEASLTELLLQRGHTRLDISEAVEELRQIRAIANEQTPVDPPQEAPANFPLQTLVMNLTNQCNLSCGYCYEYGEDKVATPEGKPKFMEEETARLSVDHLFRESAGRRAIHITFFGGETLMNFPLLRSTVAYAKDKATAEGRYIDFSLTTNGTLLTPEIIDFLATNHIGVTVSMDGPPEMQNALRVYANGRGSYDVVAPRVKMLLERHKTRPIAARVTLTAQVTNVLEIFRHLRNDLGFQEVGFAPVTTSTKQLYAITNNNMDRILDQFRVLAEEYRQCALRGEAHGFSNVSDTLAELHMGISKSHPCGAGLGLLGVGPSGDIAPCHRFVDSDTQKLGNIRTGIDQEAREAFLQRGHINAKYDCHSCWARPVCAGGCHHEALVRYGDTGHPNLHYCDWIRGWTDLCLRIYGDIALHNPAFLTHFEQRKAA